MKFFRSSGFTLVETMIAAAALSGLALVGMHLTKSMTKLNVKLSFDSETFLITNEIVAILSDPNKCLATLGGKNALSTITGINSINGNKYFSMASGAAPTNGYGNANVSIASYALNAMDTEVAAQSSHLLINYQRKNIIKGSSSATTVIKKINLYVETDASNNITNCRSLSSSSTDVWTRASGSTIYYSGGNVGIGTNAPSVALDVDGGVRAGSSSTVTNCGNGVLNGEGTQRYNYLTHNMEYCNGSSWLPVGASPQKNVQVYTSSGIFTTPTGTSRNTTYTFTVVGGGGGGAASCQKWNPGSATYSYFSGPGGGGGGTAIYIASGVDTGTSIPVTIGAGGLGGFGAQCASGNNGNISSVVFNGLSVTANGGSAGSYFAGFPYYGYGRGGTAVNGTILITGQNGGSGAVVINYPQSGGIGGSSTLGGGGNGQGGAVSGTGYGSGGAGAQSDMGGVTSGGTGASGVVIVEWLQ
jgi:hypothetical protein